MTVPQRLLGALLLGTLLTAGGCGGAPTDGRLIGVAYRGDGLMEIGELTPTDG